MLNKNLEKRLSKITKIKHHAWLRSFSWNTLFSMEMTPPYLPKIKERDDNFERIPFLTYQKVFFFFIDFNF